MLVVFRNPKDTLVSYYHFYNNNPVLPKAASWDAFYSDFMKGEGDPIIMIFRLQDETVEQ